MKLYLANKMRGLPLFGWPYFEAAAKVLRAKGHDVVNPTEIDEELRVVDVVRTADGRVLQVELTDAYDFDLVIGRDLEEVVACDGIVLGPDWSHSPGARLERDAAIAAGLAVFYGVESVPDVAPPVVTHVATPSDYDYPILDRVDMLRHQQRIGAVAARDLWVGETGNEVRVVDPDTGGAKGSKPCQLFSAPPAGLEALGKVCGMGADKYELHNFRKGYAWSLSANAMLRHYLAWNAGEDADPESGVSHLAHVAWHALVLIQFAADHPDKDDRYSPGKAA